MSRKNMLYPELCPFGHLCSMVIRPGLEIENFPLEVSFWNDQQGLSGDKSIPSLVTFIGPLGKEACTVATVQALIVSCSLLIEYVHFLSLNRA